MKQLAMFFSLKAVCFYALCVFWVSLTFSKALMEISFMIALLAWLAWKIQERKGFSDQVPLSLLIPLLGYVLISVGSHFWSENSEASFRGIFKVLQEVMVAVLVVDAFQTRKELGFFEKVFFALILFTVLSGFSQYFLGRDFLRGYAGLDSFAGLRVRASFGFYSHLAAFILCTVPFLIALTLYRRQQGISFPVVLLYGVTVIGSFVLLYLTRSRGAYIAFLSGSFIFLILGRKYALIFLLSAGVVGSFFVLPKSMIIHLDADSKEQSLVERFFLWDRAYHVIKAKPWTGTGINTYASTHAKYDQTDNWRVRDYYAHNGYLQIAAETGLPCLFFFLLFLFQYFRLSLQHARSLELQPEQNLFMGQMIGLVNFLVFALVDTVFHNPQPIMMFWFLLGLQWANQRVAR